MNKHITWDELNTYVSINTVAEILAVHRNTVLNIIKRDQLKAKKVGKQWRISKYELKDYMGE